MKRQLPRFSRTLALAAPAVALTTTRADADLFLKVDDIAGESVVSTHKDWVDLISMSFSVRNTASLTSSGGGIVAGKGEAGELEVEKFLDSSSPALFLMCARGQPAAQVKLELTQLAPSGGIPRVFYRVTLGDVIITKVEPGTSDGDDRPTETVSFAYQSIKVEYYKTDAKGGISTSPITVNWDFANNK